MNFYEKKIGFEFNEIIRTISGGKRCLESLPKILIPGYPLCFNFSHCTNFKSD